MQPDADYVAEKLVLEPSKGLVELIQKSQEAAAKEKGGEGEAE